MIVKLQNTFFATLIAGLVMCFALVGHAQQSLEKYYHLPYHLPLPYGSIQTYEELQNLFEVETEELAIANHPSLNILLGVAPAINVRDFVQGGQFNDSGALSWWDVGKVFESSGAQYTGVINWQVRRPGSAAFAWARGTETHTNPGTPPFPGVPTNIIRVPKGQLSNSPPAGTMPAGAIYCLTAELDGEVYVSQGNNNLWAANDIWEGSTKRLATHFNSYARQNPFVGRDAFSNALHEIRLHPKSTINLSSIPGGTAGSKANRPITYFYNAPGTPRFNLAVKTTDQSGVCYFRVNYHSSHEGFAVFYDGCWHNVPKTSSCNLCFGGDIYMGGQIALTVRRFDGVALQNCQVWVADNTSQMVLHHPQAAPLISDSYGRVYFTPPNPRVPGTNTLSGKPFKLFINMGNGTIETGAISAPATAASIDFTNYNLNLTSPANNAAIARTAAVNFTWGSITGAATYRWVVQHQSGAWTDFVTTGTSVGTPANFFAQYPGTWYWQIDAYNSAGNHIGRSPVRTFIIQ